MTPDKTKTEEVSTWSIGYTDQPGKFLWLDMLTVRAILAKSKRLNEQSEVQTVQHYQHIMDKASNSVSIRLNREEGIISRFHNEDDARLIAQVYSGVTKIHTYVRRHTVRVTTEETFESSPIVTPKDIIK